MTPKISSLFLLLALFYSTTTTTKASLTQRIRGAVDEHTTHITEETERQLTEEEKEK
eukprot:CAMPEP_0118713754 /NCGR_PEP_ID=MMETSP0800-20121206/25727_1 /TAXON_ID=210618 ORGANISM="Striatella unipunctata, Strain CCMP2910" /NCGR_SAMPLE_ID=MMETSP0800 /ASSEMBLY_ACC=CAM_ASM_000638 /LENGTH=56 /DNA_ID=CAMNT_0006619311 /DNA_START=127 /DNA_END=294 /DNA_ORIENTATION=+